MAIPLYVHVQQWQMGMYRDILNQIPHILSFYLAILQYFLLTDKGFSHFYTYFYKTLSLLKKMVSFIVGFFKSELTQALQMCPS